MRRCQGCGELFSVWAPRCPHCGRSAGDALEASASRPGVEGEGAAEEQMVDADSPQWANEVGSLAKTRRIGVNHRWVAIAVAVVVVAAVTAAVAPSSVSGRPAASSPVETLQGRIVVQTADGQLLTMDPDGRAVRRYPALADLDLVGSAVNGQMLVSQGGIVISSVDGRLAVSSNAATAALSPDTAPVEADSFTDTGTAIVALTRKTAAAPATASVVVVSDGETIGLGTVDVDDAAGDPAAIGAFVSIPGPASNGQSQVIAHAAVPDTGVELWDVGAAPVTLASASELDLDAGQSPSTPVDLSVFPDPRGDRVAVVLDTLGAQSSNVPVVILQRSGRLVLAELQRQGPIDGGQAMWSPNGDYLAYSTYTSSGPALAVVSLNGQVQTFPAPNPQSQFQYCVWAPSSTVTLCRVETATLAEWSFAIVGTGKLTIVAAAGYPWAWLPGNP